MGPPPDAFRASSSGPPTELTRFIGRDAAVANVRDLLATSRLLTLTGAGGSGKTRLAQEVVAGRGLDGAAAAVAWASLAAVDDGGNLPRHVAEAFAVSEEVRGGAVEALVELLRRRAGILVLDNCEHLVEACAELADALLRGCPDIRILATSREALGVPGERAWLVPAMTLPPAGAADPDALAESEAVRLFVERARDVAPDFRLTPENAAAVADVCRRLDGIPLALELAAARVRHLSPGQIRDRLDDAFALLTSGGRTRPPRHRTLLAAMDWSHDLLPDPARVLFRRLSVFRGGFTLDALEAVGGGDGLEPAEVLDLLGRLVDRSLVGVREEGGSARYDLLETVRQYAARRMEEAGECDRIRRRHAHWVADRVAEAEPHFIRPERRAWVTRLLPDLENIREALAWTRGAEPDLHVRLVGMLWWFWYSTRHWTEGGRWMSGALALPEAATPGRERAALLFGSGALAALQSRVDEARPALEEAAALAADAGDDRLEAYALNYVGLTWAGQGRPEGRAHCERAEAWFRDHDDGYGLRLALLLLGTIAATEGRIAEALALNAEGVEVARRFGQDRELAVALQNLAGVHLRQGDTERAGPLLREALAASRRDPSWFFVAIELDYLAEVRGASGRPLEAARLLGASTALRRLIGARRFDVDESRLQAALPGFREAAGAEPFETAWREGEALTLEEVLDEVLGEDVPRSGPETLLGGAVEATPDLSVHALGPFEVLARGERLPADRWSYAKPRELLVWLAANPAGGTRDDIARALWPEASVSQLKNSFHVTLHHLRKALGAPDQVVLDGGRYRLAEGLSVVWDGGRFDEEGRALLRPGAREVAPSSRLREVLALYRGDLLEGDPAGVWLNDARDAFRSLRAELTLALGEALEREGDPGAAAEVYHGLAVREDLNEEAHRRAMACWAGAGDRARALRHYERVVTLLRDALQAEPEPETTALYDRLRGVV